MGMSQRLLRPLSSTPTFSEKGYTRLWGLSTKSTATISGSAETDTGLYAVKWQGKPVEVYQSGAGFMELLPSDESANAFPVAVSGTASLSASQSKFGGGSLQLSGNGFLSCDIGATSLLGSQDFTIECWIYPLNTSDPQPIWGAMQGQSNEQSFVPLMILNGELHVWFGTSSGWQIDSGTGLSPSVGQWQHVAVVREGSNLTVYLDGQAATFSVSGDVLTNNDRFTVGSFGVEGDAQWPNALFNGYIDGLRIVTGTALYAGSSFPLPTTAPTAVTGTSLLLNFDAQPKGKRAFEVYPIAATGGGVLLHFEDGLTDSSGIGHQFTAHGNAAVSSTESAVGSQSVYFDGSDSYITAPIHPSMSLGSGDFTVEAWVYKVFGGDDRFPIACIGIGPNGSNPPDTTGWALWIRESGQVWFYRYDGATETYNAATDVLVAEDEWVHVAACRIDGVLTIYVNGAVSGSWTDTTAYNHVPSADPASNLFYSGAIKEGGGWRYATGYVDELRVVNGEGIYPSTFTPPSTPLAPPPPFSVTPFGEYETSLLLNFDGSFADSSPNSLTVTNSGATISTAQSQFGGSSGHFDGTGGFLSAGPSQALNLGDTWTVELFYRPVARTENYPTVIGISYGTDAAAYDGGIAIFDRHADADGQFSFAAGDTTLIAGSVSVNNGEWYHLALVSDSGVVTLYVNGVADASSARATTENDSPRTVYVGKNFDSLNSSQTDLNGYIDGLRIVKGKAIYTGPFDLPVAPPSVVSGEVPVGQFDGFNLSGNSLTSLRAEGVSLSSAAGAYQTYYPYTYTPGDQEEGNLSGNLLSSQALNAFYSDLLAGSGALLVSGNPGIDADDPTIATAKGYTVFGSVPPSTALLLNFNGANESDVFTDSSPESATVTPEGGARILTAESRYGGASGYFDGDALIEVSDLPANYIGTDNFTIECWVWYTAAGSLLNSDPHNGLGVGLNRYGDGKTVLFLGDNASWQRALMTSGELSAEEWHHIAIVAHNGAMRVFHDGVEQVLSAAPEIGGSNNFIPVTAGTTLLVGGSSMRAEYMTGYIDDLRIIKGAAIYTSNFTPPTSQLGVYP